SLQRRAPLRSIYAWLPQLHMRSEQAHRWDIPFTPSLLQESLLLKWCLATAASDALAIPHSARRVDAGSICAMRRVGRNVAAVAASISSSSTATKVTGS